MTEKSNFVKGVLNRKHEEKKARQNEIQNINSIIDAPPRASIYIFKEQKKNINVKQACKDKVKIPGIIQSLF